MVVGARQSIQTTRFLSTMSTTTYPKLTKFQTTFQTSYPLFKHQSTLPMLPVPTLQETCDRYLKTIRPFVRAPTQFQAEESAVAKFLLSDQSRLLQQRLIQRRDNMAKHDKSWLIDWWNEYAYFGYRDSVVLNVSYFIHFQDDARRMQQCRRAASLIIAALNYKNLIVTQKLEPEMTGRGKSATALCMVQAQFLFNSCRIPLKPSDVVDTHDPSLNTHIVVMRKGKFYSLSTVDASGTSHSIEQFESALEEIKRAADSNGWAPQCLGLLTSDNRDLWAEARERLWHLSPLNQQFMTTIESSAFVLCLDDVAPVTLNECARELWHGSGRNRWYDKTLQFIVFENGKAGVLGEHGLMEATQVSRMSDFMLESIAADKIPTQSPTASTNSCQVVPMDFHSNDSFASHMNAAATKLDASKAKHEVQVLAFHAYGKNVIKTFRVSPDVFVQMSIQLAFYKMFGECRATYESAQTRRFKHGRTEVCRSVSEESVAWVEAMESQSSSPASKSLLFKKAVDVHVAYITKACEGLGVDRHLLGLRLSLKEGEQSPEFMRRPVFSHASHWTLSTSQISSEYFDGYGWGQVVADGFGVAYMIKNNSLHYNIACLHGGQGLPSQGPGSWKPWLGDRTRDGDANVGVEVAASKFKHFLTESLLQMRQLLEKPAISAKL